VSVAGDAHAREDVFDRAVVAELRTLGAQLGTSLLAEVFTQFVDDARRASAALEAARARGDVGAVREHAHSLKGAAATAGLAAVRAAAEALEQIAAQGDAGGVEGAARRLFAEVARAEPAMAREAEQP
jgi:HPt (histidine-containing phosphotransfer) domain-containing protein